MSRDWLTNEQLREQVRMAADLLPALPALREHRPGAGFPAWSVPRLPEGDQEGHRQVGIGAEGMTLMHTLKTGEYIVIAWEKRVEWLGVMGHVDTKTFWQTVKKVKRCCPKDWAEPIHHRAWIDREEITLTEKGTGSVPVTVAFRKPKR